MGYYDDHYQTSRTSEKSSKRTIILSLISAVIGALIVVFSIPFLANNDLLPYDISPKSAGVVETVDNDNGTEKSVSNIDVSITSAVTDVVEQVSDAVVGVINMRESRGFFDPGGEGTGSGVIYKVEGDRAYIATNHHVINNGDSIDVTLSDGSRVPAELVGADIITDLAVLTIDAEQVTTVAKFGDSDNIRAGEPAIAIGNPLSFEGSVTVGVISAVERSIPVDTNGDGQPDWNAEVIQTDAAINPGNSGGALLNIQGEVIGINSMKIAQQEVEGIGFSIPSAIAVPIIEDIELYGEVKRPQMGVIIRSLQEIPSSVLSNTLGLPEDIKGGVYIEEVQPGSPADRAGLLQGDIIVKLDDKDILNIHDLRRVLYIDKSIGDHVDVTIYRNGEKMVVELVLNEQIL